MIISTTITSATKEHVIADALRSVVEWVDLVLVVFLDDPNAEADQTLDIAVQVAGDKLRVLTMPLADFEMAKARNLALHEAWLLGGTWAVMLDTDERIRPNGVDLRQTLLTAPDVIQALALEEDTGQSDKARFFRLPARGRFDGITHEVYSDRCPVLPRARVHELPKTPEQIQARLVNDLDGIERSLAVDQLNPRWLYYRGATLEAMGRLDEALDAYSVASANIEDPGIVGWIHFRVASIHHNRGHFQGALWTAVDGMKACPHMPELPWVAGIASQLLGMHVEAIAWAKVTLQHTLANTANPICNRTGFRDICAYFEGPHQVLAAAYAALGDEPAAARATFDEEHARECKDAYLGVANG